jgi:hypothetical protein
MSLEIRAFLEVTGVIKVSRHVARMFGQTMGSRVAEKRAGDAEQKRQSSSCLLGFLHGSIIMDDKFLVAPAAVQLHRFSTNAG